ncbi:MAG: hypothetical protein P8163_21365, partial [Candidatus Thiodiazotropha sp.]
MAITQRDFLRSLQPMKRDYEIKAADQGTRFLIRGEGLELEIRLGAEQLVRMGSLSLPRIQVDFIIQSASSQQLSDFCSRFELSFRRGGGC